MIINDVLWMIYNEWCIINENYPGNWRCIYSSPSCPSYSSRPNPSYREQVQDQCHQYPVYIQEEQGWNCCKDWRRHAPALLQWRCFLDAG